ncbi:hypothetical protein [Streptomyces sp. NBC_00996]|uniref:hypothetical protein n=1 Tax=Streptomyces sp. NBC_00996 TaxID=2903710 RepID=UPI003864C706|nr:hypothetical protein OG390_17445 [Streptomyces sp. NBC_00996]
MTAPSFMRRWRTKLSDAQAKRLRVLLAKAEDRNRHLEERLAELQAANEGAYRELREATGGPTFDPAQPFGALPVKGGTA